MQQTLTFLALLISSIDSNPFLCSTEVTHSYDLAKLTSREEISLNGKRALFHFRCIRDRMEKVCDDDRLFLYAEIAENRFVVVSIPADRELPTIASVEAILDVERMEESSYIVYRLLSPAWHR